MKQNNILMPNTLIKGLLNLAGVVDQISLAQKIRKADISVFMTDSAEMANQTPTELDKVKNNKPTLSNTN